MYHKPKISVIIPVYNGESYVQKAFDSVRNQTLQEIQIIFVDDGSVDKTPTILQHYKMEDNRVVVLTHSKNKGLGAARNTGVEKSDGTYLFFLDSDDYLHPNTFEVYYEKSVTEDLDILQGQFIKHTADKKVLYPKDLVPFAKPISGVDYYLEGIFVEPKACGKLWKTDFFHRHNFKFDTGYFEDVSLVFYAVSLAKRMNTQLMPGYHYVVRQDSITGQKPTSKHIDDYKAGLARLQQLFMHQDLIKPESSLPAHYALFLVDLCSMTIAVNDKDVCLQTRSFLKDLLNKYAGVIRKNSRLSSIKKHFITRKPCWYAKLKALKNKLFAIKE